MADLGAGSPLARPQFAPTLAPGHGLTQSPARTESLSVALETGDAHTCAPLLLQVSESLLRSAASLTSSA